MLVIHWHYVSDSVQNFSVRWAMQLPFFLDNVHLLMMLGNLEVGERNWVVVRLWTDFFF